MYKRQLDYEARLHKQINGIPEDPLKQRLMEEFEAEEAQVVAAATATVGSASSILQNEIEFVYRGREIMSSVAMETRLEALLDAKRVVGRYVNNYRIPIHERFTEDDFVESVRAPPPPSLTSLPSSSSVSLLEDQKDRPLLRSRSRLLDAAQHEEATPSLSSNNNAATTDAAANVGEGEGRAAAGPTLRRSSRNTTITSQSRPRRFQFSPPRTIKAADFETSALLKKIIENNDEQQHTRQRK